MVAAGWADLDQGPLAAGIRHPLPQGPGYQFLSISRTDRHPWIVAVVADRAYASSGSPKVRNFGDGDQTIAVALTEAGLDLVLFAARGAGHGAGRRTADPHGWRGLCGALRLGPSPTLPKTQIDPDGSHHKRQSPNGSDKSRAPARPGAGRSRVVRRGSGSQDGEA